MDQKPCYEAVIGLEVHAELKTATKIFCSCATDFGAEPNTRVCPICLGMPGMLPVLNGKAVTLAVRAGLALSCHINKTSWFDRKNYFYPDLPKGYQITQYDTPICVGGAVPIVIDGEERAIRLTRIHLEEDAGKLIHRDGKTLADYNRCGVPLIEIVSEPDLRTADEAKAYLNALRRILSYMGVSDCRMNEGSLRCDVNISVRPVGADGFGVKCEIKNLNSVNYVGRAIADETARQIAVLEAGGVIQSETRRYNEDTGHTERMRRKETVVDYRYFTEPNLPPLVLTDADIDAIRAAMPPFPDEAARMLEAEYGVAAEDAVLLTATPSLWRYFMQCAEKTKYPALGAHLMIGEILPHLPEETDFSASEAVLTPEAFGGICDLFGDGIVVSGAAKKLLTLCLGRAESPRTIAEEARLIKITDPATLTAWVHEAMAKSPKAVADYRGGKTTAIRQLIGAVMRLSAGGADPILTEQLLTDALTENA